MLKKFAEQHPGLFGKTAIAMLDEALGTGASVLDVGCGKNSILRHVGKPLDKTGIDHYAPYIEKSRQAAIHDKYVLGDVRNLPFESKSFDYALSSEVIEHLPKSDGIKMIKEMERVAVKGIILTTPNGLFLADPGPEDNPEEEHISGWSAGEFREMGFSVYGFGGLKSFKKTADKISADSALPLRAAVRLGAALAYHFPGLAFQLFCVKRLETAENKPVK